jgi:adenylyltransferase/sulfurtransferase
MPVAIRIPTPLRSFAGGKSSYETNAETVGDALDQLINAFEKLKPHLFQDDGSLRHFVNVYVNERDVRDLEHAATPVEDGDEISIVPSIAGGATPVAETLPQLTQEEILRFSRHLILPEVGKEGQQRLKGSRVALVGTGGLGSPASLYLAAAGVGTLGLIDFDVVDVTNLQRQVLHGTSMIGKPKLESAEGRLKDLNPFTHIERFDTRLTSQNALEILSDFDVVLDGTDNFPTRYLVNDACALLGKPNAYGSIFRFEGQASVFHAAHGPCYRCLYREPPPPGLVPSCAEGGVLGVLPGIIGSIQALEAIKLLLGVGETLLGRLLLFDALTVQFRQLRLKKDPECPLCGSNPTITELIDYEAFCGIGAAEPSGPEVSVADLDREMQSNPNLVLIDVREPHEWEICQIPGAQLLPLSQLPDRLGELDGHKDIVTQCHKGVRSLRALEMLKAAGYTRVRSLRGGIDQWSVEIDQNIPRY